MKWEFHLIWTQLEGQQASFFKDQDSYMKHWGFSQDIYTL